MRSQTQGYVRRAFGTAPASDPAEPAVDMTPPGKPAAVPRTPGRLPRLALALGLALLPATGVLAYAGLIPAPLATAGQETPSLPAVAARISAGEGLRVVAFGSSSTEGVGASRPARSYPARLQAALVKALPGEAVVLNKGVGGEAVDEMVARLDRDVLSHNPDLVIWQTGSNDPLRDVPLDHFREATTEAVGRMRAAGIDVILMEPQWCPALDAKPGAYRFRDAVRKIGEELGVPVIRRSDLMQEWIAEAKLTRRELFAPDGLHMADGGYAMLARATAAEILRDADAMDGLDAAKAAAMME